MAVELADLDLRPRLAVLHRHAAEGDRLADVRAAAAARDDADALAPDVDEVPVTGDLVALELQSDEHALRMRPALLERRPADEVLVRRLERDREPDARLERVDLVVELVAGEDEPALDAHDVERLEPERRDPVRRARLEDRV